MLREFSDAEWLLKLRGGRRVRHAMLRVPGVFPRRHRAYWYRGVPNLGDQLSPQILKWICGAPPIWVDHAYSRKILSTGSILDALAPGDTVWGSGLMRDIAVTPPPGVSFLAVRGPLTRMRIRGDVPDVYGDPALLLPAFHAPPVVKRYGVGVVPHYVDLPRVERLDPAIRLIDVRKPWSEVVSQIRECEVILSSSLHGLIVAEAYGIPAGWIRISDRVLGGRFKFNDHYLGTGRDETRPAEWAAGVAAAIRRVSPAPVFDARKLMDAAITLSSGQSSSSNG